MGKYWIILGFFSIGEYKNFREVHLPQYFRPNSFSLVKPKEGCPWHLEVSSCTWHPSHPIYKKHLSGIASSMKAIIFLHFEYRILWGTLLYSKCISGYSTMTKGSQSFASNEVLCCSKWINWCLLLHFHFIFTTFKRPLHLFSAIFYITWNKIKD